MTHTLIITPSPDVIPECRALLERCGSGILLGTLDADGPRASTTFDELPEGDGLLDHTLWAFSCPANDDAQGAFHVAITLDIDILRISLIPGHADERGLDFHWQLREDRSELLGLRTNQDVAALCLDLARTLERSMGENSAEGRSAVEEFATRGRGLAVAASASTHPDFELTLISGDPDGPDIAMPDDSTLRFVPEVLERTSTVAKLRELNASRHDVLTFFDANGGTLTRSNSLIATCRRTFGAYSAEGADSVERLRSTNEWTGGRGGPVVERIEEHE